MSRFAELEQRFEALQPRERTLLSSAVAALLALVLYVAWIEPARDSAAQRADEIAALQPQVESAREAFARVEQELGRDPEAARRILLEQLRGDAATLDTQLRSEQAAVIAPARMPAVLRDLMGRDARLSVVGVETLPPEVLRWSPATPATAVAVPGSAAAAVPPPAAPAAPAALDLPALYRHRVVLRFDGDYAATVAYLRAVEALPLRVRLDRLEVDAAAWPRLRITLQVETLGLEEGWIGV